jgi:omega-hydroxy-beta-dihydromenaquinone-9 sulfotransferase
MAIKLKHRWSMASYLTGINLDRWLELLSENRVSPAYWHRAAFVTLTAAINSITSLRERRFDEAVRDTPVHPSPLFIIGHWRSGTTHLHNLIARDPRFAFPNTYQVINPNTFLTTEETNTRRYARLVPETRPMDQVAMGFSEPQEDEFAPCLMTLLSLYLGISFPSKLPRYEKYLSFEHATAAEKEEWKQALLWFCRKLTYKQGHRPLVLKSPTHTARIRLLLEIYPDARFVHIHRHPHDVFRSNRHYWDTAVWHTYLERPDRSDVDDGIIRRYRLMHDAFHEQRSLIPPGRFHELSFQELETDPIASLDSIYKKLDLPDFAEFRTNAEAYLATLGGYRRNRFEPLDPALADRLASEWSREFTLWNYDPYPSE